MTCTATQTRVIFIIAVSINFYLSPLANLDDVAPGIPVDAASSSNAWMKAYPYPDVSYATHAGEGSARPRAGSSSMSTPQLTSSVRDASCSPLSAYDEVPSPKAESISHPSIADSTGFYMAPAGDSRCIQNDSAAYAGFALNCGVSQPWGYQGAVLSESFYGLDGTAPWPRYEGHNQSCGQSLSYDPLPANWVFASPTELSLALGQATFASPTSSQPPAPSVTAVAVPELKHPRPQRAFVPSWQTAPDFDAEQFLTGGRGSRSHHVALSPRSQGAIESGHHTAEPLSGSDSGDDMDEDWDDDFDFDDLENPGEEIDADLTARGPIDVDAGRSVGLGSSTWTLDSDSILYKPVATPLRCLIDSDALWHSTMADAYSAVTPSFA